jgi:diguanylate cyclase (GGDEF)-like protein/PAS domain S-box-containing protein
LIKEIKIEEVRRKVSQIYDNLLLQGSNEYVEFEFKDNFNKVLWLKVSLKLKYDRKKRIKNIFGILNDISYEKQVIDKLKSNNDFNQKIIDSVPAPIFYKDRKGIYRNCNVAFETYLGKSRKEIIGKSVFEISSVKFGEVYKNADDKLFDNPGIQIYEAKVKYADNSVHDVVFNKATISDMENKVIGLTGVMLDVTDRKNIEIELNKLLLLKESLLELNYSIMEIQEIESFLSLILDKTLLLIDKGKIGAVLLLDNNKTLTIAASRGYKGQVAEKFSLNLKDSFFYRVTGGNTDRTVIINNIESLIDITVPGILENVEGTSVKSSLSAPIIVRGKLYGLLNIDSGDNFVFTEEDITIMEYLRRQAAEAIEKHILYEKTILFSRYDQLTEVFNRRHFEENLIKQLKRAERYKQKFCLILFDLNKFKAINDEYGHLMGDKVLKNFASILKDQSRETDIIGRFGGDEFIALVLDCEKDLIKRQMEKISKLCTVQAFSNEDESIKYGFSFGVSNYPEDGCDFNSLIKVADENMYLNKSKMDKNI